MKMCDANEKITESQLLKLLDVFNKKSLNYKIIFKLCRVQQLSELSIHQFNYLMYLIGV